MAKTEVIEYPRGTATREVEYNRRTRTQAVQFDRRTKESIVDGCFYKPPRPNIVLVISDDMGNEMHEMFDAENDYPGAFAYPAMPSLQTIADEGVRFEHYYVSQVCSAMRASMYTGKNNSRVRIATHVQPAGINGPYDLDTNIDNVYRAMVLAGYRTAVFGKWHLARDITEVNNAGNPLNGALGDEHTCALGAQVYKGLPRNPVNPPFPGAAGHHNNYRRVTDTDSGPASSDNRTDWSTERAFLDATEWIENMGGAAAPDSPFFAVIACNAAHNPFNDESWPPSSLIPASRQAQFPTSDNAWIIASAMMEAVDTLIGNLRATLVSEGHWDNTLFIYMGDNGTDGVTLNAADNEGENIGGYVPQHAKSTPHALGCRTPLIVRGPEDFVRSPNRVVSDLVSQVDIFPTLMHIAQRKPGDPGFPTDLDGVSILNYLRSTNASRVRTHALSHQFTPNGPYLSTTHTSDRIGLRLYGSDGDLYSLLRDNGVEEFFNLTDDYHEASPLALSGAEYDAAVSLMNAELAKAE